MGKLLTKIQERLIRAISEGDVESVKLIVEKGISADFETGDGDYSPIYLAISTGNLEIVEILVEVAQVKLSEKTLEWATITGTTPIISFISKKIN